MIFLLAAAIIITPCADAKAAEKKTSKVVFSGITKNLTVKVKFRNVSGKDKYYGHYYSLQRKENGKWQKVPMKEGYGFDSAAYSVPAKNSVKYSYSLKNCFEKEDLKKGTYRILTSYDVKKKNRYVKFKIR